MSLAMRMAMFCATWMLTQGCLSSRKSTPCDRDADCDVGTCSLDIRNPYQSFQDAKLTCQIIEPDDNAHAICESSADCQHGLCVVAGSCASPCMKNADCPKGESCRDVFAAHDEMSLHARACIKSIYIPDTVNAHSETLRDAFSGSTDALDLSGATQPTLYVIEHLDDHAWPFSMNCRPPLCAQALRSAELESLFFVDQPVTAQSTPIANWPYAFPLTVYVGNNLEPTYSGKGYLLDVVSEVAGDARITKLERLETPTGILDLNLFYAGVSGFSASESNLPLEISTALEVVASIFKPANIVLGKTSHITIPEDLLEHGNTFDSSDEPRAGFSTLHRGYGVWPELPALFSLSAGVTNGGVNLFLVADIEGMGDGEVQALSGGTPGPMGMQGTGASGIAIATNMLLNDPKSLGRTMAHEISHYLGLFHTSERDGSVLEPLADTPECTLAQDANNDGMLDGVECKDYGADNLMFWGTGGGNTLTSDQVTILQRALILR